MKHFVRITWRKAMKVKTYKNMQIHYVNSMYKYDLYDDGNRWITSVNTLREARETIKNLIWARANIPF